MKKQRRSKSGAGPEATCLEGTPSYAEIQCLQLLKLAIVEICSDNATMPVQGGSGEAEAGRSTSGAGQEAEASSGHQQVQEHSAIDDLAM